MIRFTLPWAPSLNHAYPSVTTKRGKTRRVKSKALLAYREACGTHVLASSIPRFQYLNGERLAVWILCRPPTSRAFDLDNRVKAVLDALQYCGVIGNDGQVDELHIERGSMDAPLGHLFVQVGRRDGVRAYDSASTLAGIEAEIARKDPTPDLLAWKKWGIDYARKALEKQKAKELAELPHAIRFTDAQFALDAIPKDAP